jgi:hypothetical protein
MAAMTKRYCDCKHEFQDKEYGKGVRLHTVSEDGKKFRCTVCGKEKT